MSHLLEHKDGVIIGLVENGVNVVMADMEVTVCESFEVIELRSSTDLSVFIKFVVVIELWSTLDLSVFIEFVT